MADDSIKFLLQAMQVADRQQDNQRQAQQQAQQTAYQQATIARQQAHDAAMDANADATREVQARTQYLNQYNSISKHLKEALDLNRRERYSQWRMSPRAKQWTPQQALHGEEVVRGAEAFYNAHAGELQPLIDSTDGSYAKKYGAILKLSPQDWRASSLEGQNIIGELMRAKSQEERAAIVNEHIQAYQTVADPDAASKFAADPELQKRYDAFQAIDAGAYADYNMRNRPAAIDAANLANRNAVFASLIQGDPSGEAIGTAHGKEVFVPRGAFAGTITSDDGTAYAIPTYTPDAQQQVDRAKFMDEVNAGGYRPHPEGTGQSEVIADLLKRAQGMAVVRGPERAPWEPEPVTVESVWDGDDGKRTYDILSRMEPEVAKRAIRMAADRDHLDFEAVLEAGRKRGFDVDFRRLNQADAVEAGRQVGYPSQRAGVRFSVEDPSTLGPRGLEILGGQ